MGVLVVVAVVTAATGVVWWLVCCLFACFERKHGKSLFCQHLREMDLPELRLPCIAHRIIDGTKEVRIVRKSSWPARSSPNQQNTGAPCHTAADNKIQLIV